MHERSKYKRVWRLCGWLSETHPQSPTGLDATVACKAQLCSLDGVGEISAIVSIGRSCQVRGWCAGNVHHAPDVI